MSYLQLVDQLKLQNHETVKEFIQFLIVLADLILH